MDDKIVEIQTDCLMSIDRNKIDPVYHNKEEEIEKQQNEQTKSENLSQNLSNIWTEA